jgi:hypothetical protein
MLTQAVLALVLAAHAPAMGVYRIGGDTIYVGVDAEPPNEPSIQFYDTATTHRLGTLDYVSENEYRTGDSPTLTFALRSPASGVLEKPFVITNDYGRLGASLWYAAGAERRATVVLIQGADDSTRLQFVAGAKE